MAKIKTTEEIKEERVMAKIKKRFLRWSKNYDEYCERKAKYD